MIDTKFNAQVIMETFGWTESDYLCFTVNRLQSYVATYCGDNTQLMCALLNSTSFEKWYMGGFDTRNWRFIHKYCLRSYSKRVARGMKVRHRKAALMSFYNNLHTVDPIDLYPNREVMQKVKVEGGENA